jgi:hypothetical protein
MTMRMPVAVALVAQVGDALDRLGADQLRDLLEQRRLVDLVGDLADDDHGRPPRISSISQRARSGMEPRPVSKARADAGTAEDQPAGREVRARDDLHQLWSVVGLLDQLQRRVDDLARVVGRDVGRHADGDAARAVDQQVREGGRQHAGFLRALVVVRLEIDRVLVDAFQQRGGGRARRASV